MCVCGFQTAIGQAIQEDSQEKVNLLVAGGENILYKDRVRIALISGFFFNLEGLVKY